MKKLEIISYLLLLFITFYALGKIGNYYLIFGALALQIIPLIKTIIYSEEHFSKDTGIFLILVFFVAFGISLVLILCKEELNVEVSSFVFFTLILSAGSFINGVVMLDSYKNYIKNKEVIK